MKTCRRKTEKSSAGEAAAGLTQAEDKGNIRDAAKEKKREEEEEEEKK